MHSVTHPRVFDPPSPIAAALEFVAALRAQRTAVIVAPDEDHWQNFERLCLAVEAPSLS